MRCWLEWLVLVQTTTLVCRADPWQLVAEPVRHTSAVVCTNTNHDSQQRMNDQFLFYNEANISDKPSEVEPPCQTVLGAIELKYCIVYNVEGLRKFKEYTNHTFNFVWRICIFHVALFYLNTNWYLYDK